MGQNPPPTYALPTEALLEIRSKDLARCRPKAHVLRWLLELEGQGNLIERAQLLASSLQKRLGSKALTEMIDGLMAVAADGETSGVAALAALVAVRAQGSSAIEGIFEFQHLHRVAARYLRRREQKSPLEKEQEALLRELEAVEKETASLIPKEVDPLALPSPLDLGPARVPRKVFEVLHEELESKGTLDETKLRIFIRLARMEQRAAQQRVAAVAGEIDPMGNRSLSVMMPRLAQLDEEVRDVADFLSALEDSHDCRLFREQHSVFCKAWKQEDYASFLQVLEEQPRLVPVIHLLGALSSRPLEGKVVRYYTQQILSIGKQLFEAHLRPVPINPLEALLFAYEYAGERELKIPLGPALTAELSKHPLAGAKVTDRYIDIPYDLSAARRVRAPLGLPLAEDVQGETDPHAESSVKDLIMANINNTSILLGLLRNPKVVTKAGNVHFIATACRLPAVLECIASTKNLHTGFANKDVPLAIVQSPVRLPVKLVRRFIHVKYINRVDLRRLSHDKSGLRREIFDEIQDYLSSLS